MLTKKYDNGFVTLDAAQFAPVSQETMDREIRAFEPFAAAVKRLAEYEDAEEKGLLVRLPCKVGDTVWIRGVPLKVEYIHTENGITTFCGIYACVDKCTGRGEDCPFYEKGISLAGEFKCTTNGYINFVPADFGKTVFLTREEAERALKETDNDSSGND